MYPSVKKRTVEMGPKVDLTMTFKRSSAPRLVMPKKLGKDAEDIFRPFYFLRPVQTTPKNVSAAGKKPLEGHSERKRNGYRYLLLWLVSRWSSQRELKRIPR